MSSDLSKMLNCNILVGLGWGLAYEGILLGFDHLWNMVIDDAKEIVDGKLTANYGRVILRGNRILYVYPKEG